MVSKIHKLAEKDGNLGNLAFANRHSNIFDWNDDLDEEHNEGLVEEEAAPFPVIPAEMPG